MLNYKKISNSPMLTLTFWTVIAQVITFLISPITTRIFSAEEFGFYTLISSVVSMVMPILSMKFDSLIVSEKRRVEANKAVILSFFIMVFISFSVVILYYIYSIYTGIGISLVQLILFLLILIVTGVSNVGVAYANRNREYSLIGKYNFLRSVFQNILLILLGIMNFSVNGMLCALFIGNFFGLFKIMKTIPIFELKELKADKLEYKKFFIENMNLVKYSFPAHFVNSLSYTILNFLITSLYGTSVFGYYSLSFRVLGLPLTLVTQNVAKVFFQNASDEWNNESSIEKTLKKNSIGLCAIAIPFVLFSYFFAPNIFSIIFGENWVTTGNYVKILSFMFGIRLVVSSLMNFFIIEKKQGVELFFQSVFLIIALLIFIIVKYLKLPIHTFLILISLGYSLNYFAIYCYIYKNRRKNK